MIRSRLTNTFVRFIKLVGLALAVELGLTAPFLAPVMAQESPVPSPPGIISGTGTFFEVTDSDYLNVTVNSTAEINLYLNSFPTIIRMSIEAALDATSTEITLGGLEANTTYWKYEDDKPESVQFTADASGNYTFALDLSEPHDITVQPGKSTIRIFDTGGDCTRIGTWDQSTKTCTLTQDTYEDIVILASGVTLDGAGYQVRPPYTGVTFGRLATNNTVKNLEIYAYGSGSGIYMSRESFFNTAANVTVSNTYYGIEIYMSSYNTIAGNTFSDVGTGAYLYGVYYHPFYCRNYMKDCGASENNLSNNIFSGYGGGTGVVVSQAARYNVVSRNTIFNFRYGLVLQDHNCSNGNLWYYCPEGNSVYQNNFIDNIFHLTATIYQYGGTYAPGYVRTVYNLAAPDGGNYYSDYHTPAQGCDNTNPVDTFCDAPYSFPGGQDNLPWTMQIVTNQQPTVDAGGAYSGDEGSAIAMSAATATDPDGDILTYAWSTDSTLCTFDDASVLNPTLTCNDDGNFTATLTVSDGINEAVANTAGVTVNNVAPVVGDITAPIDPVPVNTAINASASFSDAGTSDTHIAEWNWGDTTCDPEGTVTYQGNGSSVLVSGSCTYTTPGIYTVKLTVTDDDGGSGTSEFKYVVVYDPDGSFVTGGGWINSPAGAYVADLALTGKANFGFMAEYKKGTNVPTGKTQFQFHAADFNFRSSTYEWLVVAGARAQFKGIGEINGSGSYGFLLFAIDGQVTGGGGADKFRIKIWDKNNEDAVVYDNELGGADDAEPTMVIGGGSIVISTVGNN